uniref:Ribonuclease Z n=1 Tax=Pleurostichidium falkenbergii TaxID=121064 RepID=A0A4D6UYL7_9FLOR|nr:ribonuclease Z [Pleurostichidium falkenbergii]QCH39583.1 ribonuclease Z [Pleurostichidium falkenbergii]
MRYLNSNAYFLKKVNISFLIKLPAVKDVWLFNCIEGSQSNLLSQSFKINNLSKIIIPDLHISSISGLLGLLSTLNLIGRIKALHIYAPIDLKHYLDLGKKYSKTSFSYILYIHSLHNGLIINEYSCRIYAINHHDIYEFFIVRPEKHGTFHLDKAKQNYLLPGPLYGKLKKGFSFLFPDGFILNGYHFTSSNIPGYQICCLFSSFYRRKIVESIRVSRVVLFI